MSRVAQQPKPTTESSQIQDLKIARLVETYPESLFRGYFEGINQKVVYFSPQNIGRGKSCSRFLFEIGDESRHYRETNKWTLNLAATTINLSTYAGGIIDGIARANGEKYLVWAFLDQYMQFAGLGCTRKPHSAFSAGTGNKGATGRSFTVTNAYQFTIGARVCVRNTNGTAPVYEWNWGTITSITNSTTIVLTMDNQTYGSNITSASGGEILQWNEFYPYIVSGSGQTLYQPYYSLVGELYTDVTSGDIERAYRADENIRETDYDLIYNSTGVVTASALYLGRWIPLWSKACGVSVYIVSNSTSHRLYLGNNKNTANAYVRIQVNAVAIVNNVGVLMLDSDAKIDVTNNVVTTVEVRLTKYFIESVRY